MVDPYRFFSSGFVRDVFERLCERVEEKAMRSLFCKSVRHLLVKMSLRRAFLVRRFRQRFSRISSTVRPFLSTDGTALFENWTAVLFINGTAVRSLKVKQYYG